MSIKKTFITGFVILATLSSVVFGSQAKVSALDNAYFGLSGSGSYAQGSTFNADVTINAGDPAISFQADIHYDASKLECVSISDSGTAFPQSYNLTCGGGSANIAATTRNKATVTSPSTVAHLTFKALAASGSTSVNFTGTGIYSGTDGHNMMAAGSNGAAMISFVAAPAPVTGGQGGGSSAPVTPAPAASNTNRAATNNNTVAHADGTPHADSDTPAAATGDVKSDTTKKEDAKKTDTTKNTAAKKSGHTVWPWIILIVLGAAAVAYSVRNRKAVVSDAKPKADKAVKTAGKAAKTAVAVPVAVAAKKAAAPVKKTTAQKPATQNRKKSGKKAGKKSR